MKKKDKVNKYLEIIKNTILEVLPEDTEVFLFGSYVTGDFTRSSDIDVGINSKKKVDKGKLQMINEKIEESIVPFNVDIVDFSKTKKEFDKVALAEVIKWR